MAAIHIDLNKELGQAKLKQLRETFGSDELLHGIRLRLLAWVDENFKRAGIETKWKPLSATTVMLKPRQESRPLWSLREKVTSKLENGKDIVIGFAEDAEIQKLVGIHHHGSGPYKIRIKNARVLAALIPSGLGPRKMSPLGPSGSVRTQKRTKTGQFASGFNTSRYLIFGVEVNHPGVPRRPLLPSDGLARKLAVDTLTAALNKAIGKT